MKIIGLAMFLFVSLSLSCGVKDRGIEGSGTSKTETRNLSGFKKIKAENAISLVVTVQKEFGVTVQADDNLLANVTTNVEGSTLVVALKDKSSAKSKIIVSISMPEITDLALLGATSADVTGIKTDDLTVEATGASTAKLNGAVKSLKAKAIGASTVDAEGLTAEKASANSVGASTITVNASNELSAEAVGASRIIYIGDPKDLKQNASDVSSISKK